MAFVPAGFLDETSHPTRTCLTQLDAQVSQLAKRLPILSLDGSTDASSLPEMVLQPRPAQPSVCSV